MNTMELLGQAQRLFVDQKYFESIEAFEKALSAGADPRIVHLSTGVARFQLKQYDRAIEDFTKALERDPQGMRAYYFRGLAYASEGNFQSAVVDLSKTIDLKPDNGAALFVRGMCNVQMGNEEEGMRDIKKAMLSAETAKQGFHDTFGILRTEFNKVFSLIEGERAPETLDLTEAQMSQLKTWLSESE
jgi:tetratricopeptide (TPR) repeat protein